MDNFTLYISYVCLCVYKTNNINAKICISKLKMWKRNYFTVSLHMIFISYNLIQSVFLVYFISWFKQSSLLLLFIIIPSVSTSTSSLFCGLYCRVYFVIPWSAILSIWFAQFYLAWSICYNNEIKYLYVKQFRLISHTFNRPQIESDIFRLWHWWRRLQNSTLLANKHCRQEQQALLVNRDIICIKNVILYCS
jgi:hypothetical protein